MTIQPTSMRPSQDVQTQRPAAPAAAPAAAPTAPSAPSSAALPAVPAAGSDRFRASAAPPAEARSSAEAALEQLDRLRTARRRKAAEVAPAALGAALLGALRLRTRETGHDQAGVAGKPAELSVKLELAGPELLSPDLAGREIAFRVDGALAGTARTDADGVARLSFTPPAEGQYKVTYELVRPEDRALLRDDPLGQGTLHVLPDRPTLVFDIDQTLSNLPELAVPFVGDKAPAYTGAVETLSALAKDYNIVYLTARDDAFDPKTRAFLFKDHDPSRPGTQAFPSGPVLYNDLGATSYKELAQMDKDRHAAFKTEALKRLQLAGVPVVAGIGNTTTDNAAYLGTRLDSFILDNAREAQQPGEFYARLRETLSDPKRLEQYRSRVAEIVESRELTEPEAVFQRDLDILTGTRATSGNRLDVLIGGDAARPEFLRALDSAKETITYQSFEFLDDAAGSAVAEKLAEKAREGVKVRVVVDAVGSRHLPPVHESAIVRKLEAAGVEVRVYNPVEPKNLDELIHRDHRKAIVIDGGKTAFLGGMNTAEHYLGSDGHPPKYHDVFVQIQGPAARDVQDIFTKSWQQTGAALSADERKALYKNVPGQGIGLVGAGSGSVRIVNHVPKQDFHIKDTYLRMIREAKDHVYVQNSFPMDRDLVDALADAARRGVKVDYVYGQLSKIDPMHLVAENKFPELLAAGVNIWRHPQFVHTKSLSIDGKVASVGSSNVDNFALEHNREVVAVVSDPDWVSRYEAELFQKDIAASTRIPSDPNDPFWRHNFPREFLDAVWPDWLE